MAPLVLEGKSLGEKHKHYNEAVRVAIAEKRTVKSADVNTGESDVDNLLNIDIASNSRNVEYILEVLKSDDMLYVSRAIQQCTWLINDQQYSHIINAQYLNTELFPEMTPKAVLKLIKHIKLHLRDEKRGEEFYNTEINDKRAVKWLPNCSVEFIEKKVKQHSGLINVRLFKRLCEKSITILNAGITKDSSFKEKRLEVTKFFLHTNTEEYLDLVEKQRDYEYPRFGEKTTDFLMKKCPQRIINKFEIYCKYVHVKTFVKYLKKEDVKDFLYTQARKNQHQYLRYFWHNLKNAKLFINLIPEEERFKFVSQVFIDKIHSEEDEKDENSEMFGMRKLYLVISRRIPGYQFYVFAPFETALAEISKLIRAETSPAVRNSMLEVLIECAGQNMQNIYTLLQYYHEKHDNDQITIKEQFLNCLISQTHVHRYDEKTWNILDEIFKSMDVYIESENSSKECVESIIIHEVIRGNNVPEIIHNKFEFSTLKDHQKLMSQEQKDRVFNYLYIYMLTKIQNKSVAIESEFKEAVSLLEMVLTLLVDWNRDILDYPWVLDKIREFIKIKKVNSWNINFTGLYNKNKSWRKHMFEESLVLAPSAEVCVNILKHQPEMLSRYKSVVEALCCDNNVSLKRLLSKLRIYWPQTLAIEWKSQYLGKLERLDGHKALIRGLCALLSRQQLLDIIQNYAPKEAKINFDETTELVLSLQRHIAKNMHFARPQPPPSVILLYAKGDYMQYALPSLLAIFYNLTAAKTREYLPKLLDAPVSTQKHGIRFAFNKLQAEELKTVFSDIWKTTKNATIRTVIFKFTFRLLCAQTEPTKVKDFWELLAVFIDNLTFEEDKSIYVLLTKDNIMKVPHAVQADYLIKSFNFLTRLLPTLKGKDFNQYEYHVKSLREFTRDLMEHLPSEFVTDILFEFIDTKFLKKPVSNRYGGRNAIVSVISAYLLCAKDEQTQTKRYEKVLAPLLDRSLASWDEMQNRDYYIRTNFQALLNNLRSDLKYYVVSKTMVIPNKLYSEIQSKLQKLPVPENYIMLTKWKLTVELTKLLVESKSKDNWDDFCSEIAPEFGDRCLQLLKEDVKLYFSCIYAIFSTALNKFLEDLILDIPKWEIFKRFLADEEFVEAYLATIQLIPRDHYTTKKVKAKIDEIRKVVSTHSSLEVKMHFNHKFKRGDDDF